MNRVSVKLFLIYDPFLFYKNSHILFLTRSLLHSVPYENILKQKISLQCIYAREKVRTLVMIQIKTLTFYKTTQLFLCDHNTQPIIITCPFIYTYRLTHTHTSTHDRMSFELKSPEKVKSLIS